MARRQGPSGGLMALRAALGAVAGGLEGYSKSQELERKRKREEEALALQKSQQEFANQVSMANVLRAAGAGLTPIRKTADPAAREAFALEAPELPAPTLGGSQMGQALAKATQGGLGVSSRPTGMLDTPISLALDTSKMRQFERGAKMQAANPAERVKLGGMELGITAPDTEEQKNQRQLDLYRGQRTIDAEMADKKARDAAAAGDAAFNTTVQRLVRGGMDEQDAIMAATLEAKYGDVAMTPSVRATMRGQDISAATSRRGQDLSYRAAQERVGAAGSGRSTRDLQSTNTQGTIIPEEIERLKSMMPKPVIAETGKNKGKIVGFRSADIPLNTTDVKLAENDWTNWSASEEGQFYYSMVGAIADAKARRSEKGTLSNQDIERYRKQVTIRIGDSDQTKYDKFQRLLRWSQEGGISSSPEQRGASADGQPDVWNEANTPNALSGRPPLSSFKR